MILAGAEELSDLPLDEEDIVYYWTFEEGDGVNTTDIASGDVMSLGDFSGNGDLSPSWREGIKGNCLGFDGKNDFSMAENIDFPGGDFSLSFWINTEETDEGRVPISYANIYETNEFLIEDPSDMKVHIRGISKDCSISLNDGRWHHVVLTWDSSMGELKVYKDTVLEFTGILSAGAAIRSGGILVLGNDQDEIGGGFETVQAFNGSLDEILLLKDLMDQEDIEDLYEYVLPLPEITEKSPDGGTWPFDVSINITFNIAMDRSTVEDAFSISPEVNGTFIWNEDTMTFNPEGELSQDTKYEVSLSNEASDIYGRTLEKDMEFDFRTQKADLPTDDDDASTDDDDDEDEGEDEDEYSPDLAIAVVSGLIIAMLVIVFVLWFVSRNKED
jgi:hypothetical protein